MKQVQIFTSQVKQYRVMQGEHVVSYFTDADMHCDTVSYKTIDARIDIRDTGTRSWKNYARLGVETVERAKEVCEKFVFADNFVGPMQPAPKRPLTALV